MTAYNVINPTTMVAGQPEDVSQVLANFQAIAAILNGSLDNSNLAAGAAIAPSKLAGFVNDPTRFLRGDGSWSIPPYVGNMVVGSLAPANVDIAAPTSSINYGQIVTAGGTVRSMGTPTLGLVGTRVLFDNQAGAAVTFKNQLAGGLVQFANHTFLDLVLQPQQAVEYLWDGAYWRQVSTPGADGAYATYTPAWTSNGTAPALGNAAVQGHYKQIGKMVHYVAIITFGSTSTFGTGSYSFSLPVTCSGWANQRLGLVTGYHGGSIVSSAWAGLQTSNTLNIHYPAASPTGAETLFAQTAPWTWANGDEIQWNLTYEAA